MHVEGTFFYNNLRIYPSAPKLRYIYYNCLAFWSNFIETHKPDFVLSTTDLHGQTFDLLPLEIGKNLGIKSFYIAPVAAYTYRTACLVDYSSKRLCLLMILESHMILFFPIASRPIYLLEKRKGIFYPHS